MFVTAGTIKRVDADATDLTTIVTKTNLFRVQWGYLSDFIVYFATGTAGEAYKANPDGTGETVLSSFGTNSKSASIRFLAGDDWAVYPIYQTLGPGDSEIYEVPTDASGMTATDIWTTGNSSFAFGRPHVFGVEPTRWYVCDYPDPDIETTVDFVSHLLDGTDRRVEDAEDAFNILVYG